MEKKIKMIIEWTKTKIKINLKTSDNVYFYIKEIWWTNIGSNIGFEQDGKGKNFSRPILIIKKFNKNMLWAIPLTSKHKEGNYFYNLYHQNNNYTLILPQLKLISSKRLIRKITKIPQNDFTKIKSEIKKFL
jgi:mRNA interferase MazF